LDRVVSDKEIAFRRRNPSFFFSILFNHDVKARFFYRVCEREREWESGEWWGRTLCQSS